jgi:hypothetical protein
LCLPLRLLRLLLQEHYPELMKDVKIRIIELMDHVLSTYDRKISEYTAKRFSRAGAGGRWAAGRHGRHSARLWLLFRHSSSGSSNQESWTPSCCTLSPREPSAGMCARGAV